MTQPTLKALQAQVRAFADERDWGQFHHPRNLAMALSVEAAELLECYLWTRDDAPAPEDLTAVEDEAADVLICLLNFAERAGIDLTAAFARKIANNAQKYPVERARGSARKYTAYKP